MRLRTRSRTFMAAGILAALLLGQTVAAETNVVAARALVANGSMTDGSAQPEAWHLGSYKEGVVRLGRDTTVFHTAPAALLIATEGQAMGFAQQALQPLPNGPVTISGAARAEGTFNLCQVIVQVFDATWKQVDWKVVHVVKTGPEWQTFQATVSLPATTAHALVGLVIRGDGKAWLDDLSAMASNMPAGTENASLPEPPPPPPAEPLPLALAANDPHLHYTGRFDWSDPAAPRCAWPASAVTLRFHGRALNARLKGAAWVEVVIDGQPAATALVLRAETPRYRVAEGLADADHTVTLVKRTEPHVGALTVLGFELGAGAKPLPPLPVKRRIEVIGDSISAGYGNEAASQKEHFSAVTENAWQTYGAMTARAMDAEYVCIAWSGKCLWPRNMLPDLYDRILPDRADSHWDFASWTPDVVLVNLGTNDFAGGNPEEEGWVGAYHAFIARIRKNAPHAYIYCALGPMMNDTWSPSKTALTTARRYVNRVVTETRAAGDTRVSFIEFPMQTGANGFGGDWHPNIKTHRLMADKLIQTLEADLKWTPATK